MNILELPLASIEVGNDRARDLEPAWAEALSVLIGEQGLQQPILVRAVEGQPYQYRLIAGLHRLKAFEILGLPGIPAYLSSAESDEVARLEEVMENLGRYELIALDRCHHLYELKQLYDRKHPNASRGGGDRTSGKTFPTGDEQQAEVFGFAAETAEKVGLSKRAINMAVRIWTGLAPQTRKSLRGTDLARKQTELKALSEIISPKKQAEVLAAILDEELPEVGNVAQAVAHLEGSVAEAGTEKQFQAVRTAFARLPDAAFDLVVAAEADRVIASLKRLGRI